MNVLGFEPKRSRLWLLENASPKGRARASVSVDLAKEVWAQVFTRQVTCLGSAEGLLLGKDVPVKRVDFAAFVKGHVTETKTQLRILSEQDPLTMDEETHLAYKVTRGMLLDGLSIVNKLWEEWNS